MDRWIGVIQWNCRIMSVFVDAKNGNGRWFDGECANMIRQWFSIRCRFIHMPDRIEHTVLIYSSLAALCWCRFFIWNWNCSIYDAEHVTHLVPAFVVPMCKWNAFERTVQHFLQLNENLLATMMFSSTSLRTTTETMVAMTGAAFDIDTVFERVAAASASAAASTSERW